jgi:hypothetical protein
MMQIEQCNSFRKSTAFTGRSRGQDAHKFVLQPVITLWQQPNTNILSF